MEKRLLGRTGESLSIIGFGGIVVMNVEPTAAKQAVAQAVEKRGINYFDVAPSYGNAEERLGPALEAYRDSVFLACKTGKRDAVEAEKELSRSLERLKTDHFDLYQLHGVTTLDEVQQILGPGGALETFVRAREQGRVRFLGFSAHTEEAALALLDGFDFDSILFPFNWVCWNQGRFGPRVLQKAVEKQVGILALKTLAKRKWTEDEQRKWTKTWYSPVDTPEEALMAVRFTLSKPITAAVSPGHAELLWWACDAAERFTPLSDKESKLVAARSSGLDPIFPQQRG